MLWTIINKTTEIELVNQLFFSFSYGLTLKIVQIND